MVDLYLIDVDVGYGKEDLSSFICLSKFVFI